MSAVLHCDGCGVELGRFRASPPRAERLIHGYRDEDSGQGLFPIPDDDFDWCRTCAFIAFRAVKDARTVPAASRARS